MAFRPEDLHDLDTAHEVRIETHRPNRTTRSVVIWVVVDKGQVFVRSVRGTAGRWYQEALAQPAVTLDDAGRRLEARAIAVRDADSIRRVSDALQRKYKSSGGLAEMLVPGILDATLRLDPRSPDELPLEAPDFLGADEPSELGPPIEVGMLDAGGAIEERVLLQPHKSV